MNLLYPLKNGIYWIDGSHINEWQPIYLAYHDRKSTMDGNRGFIPTTSYIECKSGRIHQPKHLSVFINVSSSLTKSTINLTIFEFKPNHVNIPEFKLFQKEKSLSEIQLYKPNGVRTFGISNEVFGMVIDAARVGKGLAFNKQLNEWEPCSMLYKRD